MQGEAKLGRVQLWRLLEGSMMERWRLVIQDSSSGLEKEVDGEEKKKKKKKRRRRDGGNAIGALEMELWFWSEKALF